MSNCPEISNRADSTMRQYIALQAGSTLPTRPTIADPGVVEVFDIDLMERTATIQTERGAHTLGFDADRNKVYAFLPETHRAVVYTDKS